MTTPISDLQKGRLEKIVIENNTYDRYYVVKHASEDAKVFAKHQKDLKELENLDKKMSEAYVISRKADEVFSSRQAKELEEFRAKQKKEEEIFDKKNKADTDSIAEKKDKITENLRKAGLTSNSQYIGGRYVDGWRMDTQRFNSEYVNWLRDLRAKIITATSAEEAKKLVDEFLLK